MAATKAHRYVPEMREIATAHQAAGRAPARFAALADVYADLPGAPLAQRIPRP